VIQARRAQARKHRTDWLKGISPETALANIKAAADAQLAMIRIPLTLSSFPNAALA
jgi:hypothetical protein